MKPNVHDTVQERRLVDDVGERRRSSYELGARRLAARPASSSRSPRDPRLGRAGRRRRGRRGAARRRTPSASPASCPGRRRTPATGSIVKSVVPLARDAELDLVGQRRAPTTTAGIGPSRGGAASRSRISSSETSANDVVPERGLRRRSPGRWRRRRRSSRSSSCEPGRSGRRRRSVDRSASSAGSVLRRRRARTATSLPTNVVRLGVERGVERAVAASRRSRARRPRRPTPATRPITAHPVAGHPPHAEVQRRRPAAADALAAGRGRASAPASADHRDRRSRGTAPGRAGPPTSTRLTSAPWPTGTPHSPSRR